ncbi:hypothetical protein [Sulfitobacter sp. R18_1]|uniref:hypothetical protein n=1 Tax=Sulfitobacter sp. R18_1 TaxID=2821104 RepID=UPI001ADB0EE9|nr:hypothetical protein [Sulfitobacter sp. R18_1]MBO9428560.1 hypothetical protein [Sulfitobacter sp. R18_1]
MTDFKEFISERGYKPIFKSRATTTAWFKNGVASPNSVLVNSVIYDQTHRKDKPSYAPERAYLVAAELAHNNGQMETAWVHEEASIARLCDEIIFAEMVACDNIVDQKKIAADYLGADLLTKYVSDRDIRAEGIPRSTMKEAFYAAAQEARFNNAPQQYPVKVPGEALLQGMFELDGVKGDYSRFRFKGAPVHIEAIRDPKGLGARAHTSGYLVTADMADILIPADFTKVGFGCHVGEEFAKAVRMASTVGLSLHKDPAKAFDLLSSCFELSVFDDGGDQALFDKKMERTAAQWGDLIDKGYRAEMGEDLIETYESSAPSAPGP